MWHTTKRIAVYAVALVVAAGMGVGVQAAHPVPVERARAVLHPESGSRVNGLATLTLNLKTHVMTVVVTAAGLKPDTLHPEHIHLGACPHFGKIVYWLRDMSANAKGDGRTVTTFHGVKTIPARGWLVNIHQGPGLSGKGLTQIACGNVVHVSGLIPNPGGATSGSSW